ncbi:MAG: hypothetical protein JXQ90_22845 [Cyclobacteriaceae bacterium]
MDLKLLVDIVGWIGSIEVIIAYWLVSTKRVDGSNNGYHLLNLTGGIFLIINTMFYGSFPSTFINVVWVIIALFAMYNIAKSKTTNA